MSYGLPRFFPSTDFRCNKRGTGGRGGSSSSGSMTSSGAVNAAASAAPLGSNSGSSKGSSSRSDKSSRPTRIPFHKRRLAVMPFGDLAKLSSSSQGTQSQQQSQRHGGTIRSSKESSAKAAGDGAGGQAPSAAKPTTSLFNILPQRLVPALCPQLKFNAIQSIELSHNSTAHTTPHMP